MPDFDDAVFQRELVSCIPHMRAFARSLCGNVTEAEDLAQEAVLKAWQARTSYTPGTNLKAWTFMILRNQFYSEKRRSWRQQALPQETAERILVASDDPTAALELEDVRRALMLLPVDMREALILIGAGGFSYEDAAEVLGVAIGTVKSRVSRARDRLAQILVEGRFEDDGASAQDAFPTILRQIDELAGRLRAA